jgi:hypothetical protein
MDSSRASAVPDSKAMLDSLYEGRFCVGWGVAVAV